MLAEASEERLPFSKDQVKDLLRVADNQWQGMILLGYHTGIRLSDAANLTWANIDLLNRTLVFWARKTAGRIRTGQKDSVVYMHQDLVTYFESLPGSDDPNAPIFPSLYRKTAGSHGGLSNAFGRLMGLAGIRTPLGPEKRVRGVNSEPLASMVFVTVLFRGWLTLKCQRTCANKLSGIPATTSTGVMSTWTSRSRRKLSRIFPVFSEKCDR
jgi:hypothetical protein